ncbi:MAG TPA: phytoene dehydrogenase [Polyangiaceae bacterium]|nr:phytoene dehydrogenase [Polyangiaceae bacterium]
MTSRFYDAVVLGRSLGSLTAAALLARRDFRVLLLGQGERPQLYRFDGRALGRRTFSLLFGSSPIWRRILHELAQSPQFRRRTEALDPMFCALMPNRRLEFAPDVELFAREVDREFPEVRQVVDELYASVAQANALIDAAFDRDAVWPPGTLWERFETGRAAALLPLTGGERSTDLLAKFPSGHPFRELVQLPAAFASNLAANALELPALPLARLHGSWTRGVQALARAEEELCDFLVERIRAHGGVVELDRRAASLHIKNGAAAGVVLDGDEEPTGASAVVCNQWGESLAELSGGEGITKSARKDWPRLTVEASRFVVSLVVKRSGLQSPLGRESFLLPARRDPRRPLVHLQRLDAAAVSPGAADDEVLLIAECLLPARGSLSLLEARQAVLSTLRESLPFLDQHLVLVDSPHDGLPLQDYSSGLRRDIDRIHVPGSAPAGEAMERLWAVDPAGYRELSGEPVRGPIPQTFLVGKTVLPALGQEGELLAAVSAARIITQRDRARQRLRRQMWSKIETT